MSEDLCASSVTGDAAIKVAVVAAAVSAGHLARRHTLGSLLHCMQ